MNDGEPFLGEGEFEPVAPVAPAEAAPVPSPAMTWSDIGVQLARDGHLEAGAACIRRALCLEPDHAILLSNLGNILRRAGHYAQSKITIDRAVSLNGEHKDVVFNKGVSCIDFGEPAVALDYIERALAQDPGNGNFRFARASALLSMARYREGFEAYQCRLDEQKFACPFWNGKPLAPGHRLLLHAEQGMGDTIMFHRYVGPLLKWLEERGSGWAIDYVVHPPLAQILGAQRAGCVVPDMNWHLPVMSIPHVMGWDDVSGAPYLAAQHTMGMPVPPGATSRIGICWRAKTTIKTMTIEELQHGSQKSIPLESFLELARIKGAALYSLQHGGRDDVEALAAQHIVVDLSPQMTDFADLASYINQMDLVVTVDTAVAHLAGAMGKKTLVLVHNGAAWHWTTGTTTPWYDSVRVVRPDVPGQWDFSAVVDEVEKCLTAST